MVENLELCMNLRHEADYGLTYHQESAEIAIKFAKKFLDTTLNFFELRKVGPLRFELKSIPPQGTRMPSYPTGPELRTYI